MFTDTFSVSLCFPYSFGSAEPRKLETQEVKAESAVERGDDAASVYRLAFFVHPRPRAMSGKTSIAAASSRVKYSCTDDGTWSPIELGGVTPVNATHDADCYFSFTFVGE